MKLAFFGAGNVAQGLAHQAQLCGHEIVAIWSRRPERAAALVQALGGSPCSDWPRWLAQVAEADLLVLAIQDDALPTVVAQLAEQLPWDLRTRLAVVHTSGTVGADALFGEHFPHYGVLYPLQTFSQGKAVDFARLPWCLYGHTPEVRQTIEGLAQTLGGRIYWIDDAQRMRLHLAAVVINNFSNYLFKLADDFCRAEGLAFEMLLPLLQETVDKLKDLRPEQAQTGPARRGDVATIARHQALLQGEDKYRELDHFYRLFSQAIIHFYHPRKS